MRNPCAEQALLGPAECHLRLELTIEEKLAQLLERYRNGGSLPSYRELVDLLNLPPTQLVTSPPINPSIIITKAENYDKLSN